MLLASFLLLSAPTAQAATCGTWYAGVTVVPKTNVESIALTALVTNGPAACTNPGGGTTGTAPRRSC